jgi:hypothetical protein
MRGGYEWIEIESSLVARYTGADTQETAQRCFQGTFVTQMTVTVPLVAVGIGKTNGEENRRKTRGVSKEAHLPASISMVLESMCWALWMESSSYQSFVFVLVA